MNCHCSVCSDANKLKIISVCPVGRYLLTMVLISGQRHNGLCAVVTIAMEMSYDAGCVWQNGQVRDQIG